VSSITPAGGTYESKAEVEALPGPEFVNAWMEALDLAEREEKDWVKEGEDAIKEYRGDKTAKNRKFNIFHANIETICPALYNSTPAPDVRRRFSDDDPAGKQASDIIERALSFSVDAYDFDALMKMVVKDGELAGRGVARVRYVPVFGADGLVAYEQVSCDYVPWRYFRRGPGQTWKDVPWVAFGDFLTKEQIAGLLGPERQGEVDKVPLNYAPDRTGQKKQAGDTASIFRRGMVWQIWDRDNRRVISICPDYPDAPIAMVPDPLELTDFYPIPRPYQPIMAPDSLVPVVPYEVYKDLVDELNTVSRRISALIRQLRVRGLYGAPGGENDLMLLANAEEGALVPAKGLDAFAGSGGIDKWIAWFPLDPIVQTLKQLVVHREQVKQTIYEVTGIADILRGSTNAGETATAQQIKAQWGSLRVQDRQGEVARVARDLFRLKAEVIASKFSWSTLSEMTGIQLPTAQEKQMAQQQLQAIAMAAQGGQPPQIDPATQEKLEKAASSVTVEEVEKLLRSDILRAYRIDVESNSTIRGDLTRNQQDMNMFLQGTAQFAAAMGPILMQFKDPKVTRAVFEVYSSFARNFKLGKQAEDALDGLADSIGTIGAAAQQQQPDPKAEAEKARAESIKMKAAADTEKTKLNMQATQAKHGMEMQELAAEQQAKQMDAMLERQQFETDAARAALMAQMPQQIVVS